MNNSQKNTNASVNDDDIRISDIVDEDAQTYDGNDINSMNQPGHDSNPSPLTGKDNYRIYTKSKGISEDSESQDADTPGMIGGDSDSD